MNCPKLLAPLGCPRGGGANVWVANVLVWQMFSGGKCSRAERVLEWQSPGGNCPGGKCPRVASVLRWQKSGWQMS